MTGKIFMKKSLIFGMMLLLAMAFSSCGGKKLNISEKKFSIHSETDKKITIGFSIDTLAIERWQRDLDIFMNTATNLGAEVIVQNAGNDAAEQNKQLLYLASQNVDVVVIVPRESKALIEAMEKFKAKNIPVISYDRLILDSAPSLYMTIDSEKVGYIMGQHMRSITPLHNWALILGSPDDNNMNMIEKGILKSIRGTNITIIDTFFTSGWNYDLSRKHTTDLITSGIIPEAIICGNDAVADSVISVLDEYLPKKHIPICGQDADIAACQNIVKGKQDFTIYKPINRLAELAAEYSVKIAEGTPVSELVSENDVIDNGYAKIPYIMLEPICVDAMNIENIVIDSGFHTYGEIFQ